MNFEELMDKRYSVRKFSDKPIEQEKLDKVLEAAMKAPTAKNQQPEKIYVLKSQETLDKVDALTPVRYGANTVLVFTYDENEDWKNPDEEDIHSGVEDASIAATYAMFEAVEQGLATCWCNRFPYTQLHDSLGIPSNEKIVLIMPIGYAPEGTEPSPRHFASKDVSEMIRYM
ncbi:MAG: nitroreductase [Lachnospiraceae bacterium]|uniref:Nitroreductase n=1 Tax=Candidatus Weimeria bifida TaxID=2599074 RepID=A0A6N7IYZ2_9FIRM|nr:nitroreductase [Candidatus Weimeria bifida]RRF97151.1 MAG: nitroreductase [Lachnospiraceae bacterium]